MVLLPTGNAKPATEIPVIQNVTQDTAQSVATLCDNVWHLMKQLVMKGTGLGRIYNVKVRIALCFYLFVCLFLYPDANVDKLCKEFFEQVYLGDFSLL